MQKTRFSQKLSNLELWCLLTTYWKLCNWAFQRTHYWILKIDMTVIFSAEGGPIWIKFRRLRRMTCRLRWFKIETRCRITIWRTFGWIQWHVIPEPPAILQGAATSRIQCHDSRATCHIAGCCHRANSQTEWPLTYVISEPRITLQGAATWWIHCHDSRATCHIAGCSHLAKSMSRSCHIAGCKNFVRHIENRFSPYFISFCF